MRQGSIPDRGTKIPHASWPEDQNMRQGSIPDPGTKIPRASWPEAQNMRQDSIPDRGTKIPRASWPEDQNMKQEQYCNKFSKDLKICINNNKKQWSLCTSFARKKASLW